MSQTLTKQTENGLSAKEYQTLFEVYQKLGQFFNVQKKKKKETPKLKTLKGIWKGVKIDEEDFEAAEKSLFKTDL